VKAAHCSSLANQQNEKRKQINQKTRPMKAIKILTLAALAAALLFQIPTTRAGDNGKGGDDGKREVPSNPFVDLLDGIYQPVVHAPNFGLTQVDLDDGSYSEVPIYNVSGIPDAKRDKPVGTFYVQFNGNLCAYHLPDGSLSAMFLNMIGTTTDDGGGSWTFVGTEDLVILEGVGIYAPFAGGSIHMVDVLKFNAVDGTYIEHCFCHVSH
jgi:hypothetical protein